MVFPFLTKRLSSSGISSSHSATMTREYSVYFLSQERFMIPERKNPLFTENGIRAAIAGNLGR